MRKTSDIHVSRIAGSTWWKVSHRGKVLSFHHTQATAIKAAIRLARALRATRRRRGVDVVTHSIAPNRSARNNDGTPLEPQEISSLLPHFGAMTLSVGPKADAWSARRREQFLLRSDAGRIDQPLSPGDGCMVASARARRGKRVVAARKSDRTKRHLRRDEDV